KRAYCLKTQPATGETYPKSDLFNKACIRLTAFGYFSSALKKGISDIKGSGSSLSSRVEQWTLSWQSKVTS
ncbi:hypothetical protein, partial [Klebsiella pneumoniae]|uniref:hypothetical protein n=1 Tax=Klebsiella pneumoniae TaxID=573 RepID=UPI003D028F3B